jgi:TMEM175 potassium channel family protein
VTPPAEEKDTGRIEAFSDGVFAIAITLLILEIRVPHLPVESGAAALCAALGGLWPSYVAFLTSFLTIFIMWANHHAIFHLVRRADARFLYANGFLLLLVTFVPFPTAILAEYLERPAAPAATAFYAGTFVAIGVAFWLLWQAAIRERRLLRAHVTEEMIEAFTKSYRLGAPGYLVAAAAAFVNVFVSIGICAALAGLWIAVSRNG